MTTQKALKKDIRERMAKTGERYTAARRNVRAKAGDDWVTHDLGVSDEKVKEATGCDWKTWIYVLDRWGAREASHREIARYVEESYNVSGWWAQTVTIGYERARGMRDVHQRTTGFAVSVTKTLPIEAGRLRPLLADGRKRSRWLEKGALSQRPGKSETTLRFDAGDGSRVQITLVSKGEAKTTVAIEHQRLKSKADVEVRRAYWKERLAVLAEVAVG
jgi:hypothetical protein